MTAPSMRKPKVILPWHMRAAADSTTKEEHSMDSQNNKNVVLQAYGLTKAIFG